MSAAAAPPQTAVASDSGVTGAAGPCTRRAAGRVGARLVAGARRHPVPIAVTAGVIGLQAACSVTRFACPRMSMIWCLLTANLAVLGASAAAVAVRAAWLGVMAGRAVAALPRAAPPASLASAASRAGIRRIRCLAGSGATAFCAGVAAPAVYVTAAAADVLTPGELDAVLAHEAAHARRRDPLRRLLARAAADALFYLPLARWWSPRLAEAAELRADRAAAGHAGRKAVAAALLAVQDAPVPAAAAAHGGATDARVAQLLGDALPARRFPAAVAIVSVAGLIAAVWLAMCLAQAVPAWAGLA